MSNPVILLEAETEPVATSAPSSIFPPSASQSAHQTTDTPTIDWPLRQRTAVRRLLNGLERISLALETPVVRIVRQPQLNPLYHTGTITLFALLIILVTGIYLTMFYPFGFDESYQAVARMESNFVGRLMRALHRYASALALIAALLHGWRMFFMDRFRGPRWLAWATGVVLTIFVWGAGLTGYWLIFDERAQLFNQALIDLLGGSAAGVAFLNQFLLTEAADQGWLFVLGVLTVHLGLSALIAAFFLVHIMRLRRAKILPPRYWMLILGGLVLLGAVLVPAGMLPPADPGQLPTNVPIDIFYLFYLPALMNWPPGLFWGLVGLVTVAAMAVPWLLLRKRLLPVQVYADRCTGCTLCAADCPYKAITMVERQDDSGHKYLAVIDPKRCVSCGVCIGSCPPLALTLGDRPPEPLWQTTVARAAATGQQPVRVVFTCERHAAQGGRAYLAQPERGHFGGSDGAPVEPAVAHHVAVIPLTCIGMAHPDLAGAALKAGAAEVQFVGCPPEDCANREGNVWMQQRLERLRLPKLRRQYVEAAIASDWEAPNDFGGALRRSDGHQSRATAYGFRMDRSQWVAFLPGLLLLAVVLAISIALTAVPFTPPASGQAIVRVDLTHRSGYPVISTAEDVLLETAPDLSQVAPTRLIVEANGQVQIDRTFPPGRDGQEQAVQALEQIRLPAGEHHVRVLLADQVGQTAPHVLADQVVRLAPGQVLSLQFKDARLSADPVAGRRLFNGDTLGANTGCRVCHSLEPDVRLVGPSLAGVAARAGQQAPDLTAAEYLRQSILEPNAHVVEGFPANQMPPTYAETLTDQQVSDLVGFLLTLQ
jgi:ferredoxin/cytochrome c551/c552